MKLKIIAIVVLLAASSACSTHQPTIDSQNEVVVTTEQNRVTVKENQAKVLANIAVGYAKLEQKTTAEQILTIALESLKTIQQDSFSKDLALIEVAIAYGTIGQYPRSIQVANLINDSIQRDTALRQVGALAVEAKQYDQAIQVAKEMGNTRSTDLTSLVTTQISSKFDILTRVAVKYAQARQYDQALQVAKLIEDTLFRVKALGEVALQYAEAGQKAKAQQILDQALESARAMNVSPMPEKANALAEIATQYIQVGQKEKALQILAQALQYNDRFDGLLEVALKYAEIGQKLKAQQLLAQALEFAKSESHSKVYS